ncbi:MAG: GNAT family N-acetyltransferase [Planctomycetaceae bacterium]|nr:GNAT family N-acetyltransferase [Planctomycetaceae bacterium]
MSPSIRKAQVRDVQHIGCIVNDSAERGLMLHRSLAELYDDLRDFHVAESDEQIVGVTGLRVMWSNLSEVYALAVVDAARGRGLGRKLVEAAADEARDMGIRRLFALTYEKEFFEKCDFSVVDRRNLPLKVWSECVRCPKHDACDEIAMQRELKDVPDLAPSIADESIDCHDVHVPIQLVRLNGGVPPRP